VTYVIANPAAALPVGSSRSVKSDIIINIVIEVNRYIDFHYNQRVYSMIVISVIGV